MARGQRQAFRVPPSIPNFPFNFYLDENCLALIDDRANRSPSPTWLAR